MRGPRPVGGALLLPALVLGAAVAALPDRGGAPRAGAEGSDGTRAAPAAQERGPAAPVRVVDLGPIPRQVRESSGLAVSRRHPGIFWTHNDSGDGPKLYALDATASLVGVVEVEGVDARDWEALDIGPCPGGAPTGGWCLYVADTGDNDRRRPSVAVYVVPEPDPRGGVRRVKAASAVRFRYQGGPFDVEALATSPAGDLVLVTKGREARISVFEIPAAEVARAGASGETLLLRSPVTLPVAPDLLSGRWVTGASFGPGGAVLALRTYTEVYFYRWPLSPTPAQAAPVCRLGRLEPSGEAIALSQEGRIYLTSETLPGRTGHLLEIECAGIGG